MAEVLDEKSAKKVDDTTTIVAAEKARGEILTDKNGFPLRPQPVVGDELDPLNWSSTQKHVMLAIVMALCVSPSTSSHPSNRS